MKLKKLFGILIFCSIAFVSCDDCGMLLVIKNLKSSEIKIVSSFILQNSGKDSVGNEYAFISSGGEIQLLHDYYCDFETSALPDFLTIIAADTVIHFSNQEELAKMFHCEGKMKGDRCKSGTWVYEVK